MSVVYTERRRGYGAIEREYLPVDGDLCVLRDCPADGMFWLGNAERAGKANAILRRCLNESDLLEYYITVRDGERVGLLRGPYYSHTEALADVPEFRARACEVDSWAHFYQFGTSSMPRGTNARVLFT